jgi:hypothetical protein
MNAFVWTKMGVESGEGLAQIVRRKEVERIAGRGIFWWGIGNSLGPAVRDNARAQGGTLPVLFSTMLGRPKHVDESPDMVWRWTVWEDEHGRIHDVPAYVKVISRGETSKQRHYAPEVPKAHRRITFECDAVDVREFHPVQHLPWQPVDWYS